MLVNNLNETAILHVHNYTVLKGAFANEQKRILPVIVNDLKFWNQLLTSETKTRNQERTNDYNRFDDRYTNSRFNKRSIDSFSRYDRQDRNLNRLKEKSRMQTFKKYTFILFGRTGHQLNGNGNQKLTLFFPITNRLPYLKKLYLKHIRGDRVNCNEQHITQRTKSNLESNLYFESQNYNQFNTSERIYV